MATCPVCGTEIEAWASYCPSCDTPLEWESAPTDQGGTDEEKYYDDWYYPPGPRKSRPTCLILGGLVAALFVCACICCFGLFIVDAYLPEIEALLVAEATATPAPAAPPYEQIRSQMQAMTEAQWKQYAEELKGATAVNWTGWIEDVNQKALGGYELWVDMDSPDELLSVQDVQFDIPEDLALQLQKDQKVTFSGRIDSVMNILGSCSVTLEDVTVTPLEDPPQAPPDTSQPQIQFEAGSYTSYRDSAGMLHFVGEVVNNSDIPAERVQIALSLLDDQGNVLVAESANLAELHVALARGKYPFRFMIDELGSDKQWATVKIQVQAQPYTEGGILPYHLELRAENVTGQPAQSEYDTFSLSGMVVNFGQKPVSNAHVVAVAYNGEGKVIDVGDAYAQLEEIAPGNSAPFQLDFGSIRDAPASYEIFVQGWLVQSQ